MRNTKTYTPKKKYNSSFIMHTHTRRERIALSAIMSRVSLLPIELYSMYCCCTEEEQQSERERQRGRTWEQERRTRSQIPANKPNSLIHLRWKTIAYGEERAWFIVIPTTHTRHNKSSGQYKTTIEVYSLHEWWIYRALEAFERQ